MRREGAGDRRDDEADDDRGSGDFVGGTPGEGEDARADHDADAEDGEIECAQRFLEPELRFVGVGDGLLYGLRSQKTHDLAFLRRVDR